MTSIGVLLVILGVGSLILPYLGLQFRLMELVDQDHPVYVQWITDEQLAANPGIVKSKNVRPPMGLGRVSLVCIGENSSVDSQPCGGTHVSRTGEVGRIHIAKIEKKGKENRRFRIRFGDAAGD